MGDDLMRADSRGHRLRILHLILNLRTTNSQYNEHSLPVMYERDITLCTYFTPQLTPPPQIRVFAGNDTIRGVFRALHGAFDADEYDAIHAHSPHMGVLLIMTIFRWPHLAQLRHRTVYTVHDSFYDYKTRNKLLMIPVLAMFSRVVFCSHAAYESLPRILKRLVRRRMRIVQNGVDIARIDRVISSLRPDHDETFTVVSIGRIEKVKDPLAVLLGFMQIDPDKSGLVFLGEGDLRPELERAIADAGLADRVALTGLVDREEVFRYLMAADVFASASHGEGLPVAVMEALACSVPVILSDIPPHREFGADPSITPLVAPGDIAGFARELAKLRAMSPDERIAIGRAGRDLVTTTFSLERMSAGYEAIYREIASAEYGAAEPGA